MIISLMGPTASGKTDMALALADLFPLEIISVDSALVYQEMDIGTAKPSKNMLAAHPHHLIDIITPDKAYSVAEFLQNAKAAIATITAKGKIPFLVGGTMLYFKALITGLADIPAVPSEIRLQLKQRFTEEGLDVLYEELTRLDPVTAMRLHVHDQQRILRALEVYLASQKPLSYFIGLQKPLLPVDPLFLQLALMPEDRELLHQKLALRFQTMLNQGFVEEVAMLQKKYNLTPEHGSMRAVGYRQISDYLAGKINYAVMQEQGIAASRQLAKRQLTWLRPWQYCEKISALNTDSFLQIKNKIALFLEQHYG